MNHIKESQNEPTNLKYLAAQRTLYSRAKQAFGLQVLFTVILSAIFSFLKLIPKASVSFNLNAYIGLTSILISFADILFFNTYISGLKKNGAKVQELFDCNLFDLSWNTTNSGVKPDKDLIEKFADRYIYDDKALIENWYDINLDNLSRERAVLLCQETNLFYDGKLREHFKKANILICISMFFISFIIALINNMKVDNFITNVLLPTLPIIALTLKVVMENKKSLTASIELKQTLLQLKAKEQEATDAELRQIQDKIFCSRKDSALVPEWYYKWRRKTLEKAMQANAN